MRQVGDRSLSVYRLGDQLHPYVAATNRFVCAGDLFKIFVSATEFCRCNKSQKKTLCDLLGRQNSVAATKIFTKGLQYTRSNLSLQKVAATCCCNSCRLVCTDPQDFIETLLSLMMVFHLSGTTKNRSQDCQRFNLWKLTKWSFRWTVRRKTQRCDDLYRGRG